MTLDKGGGRMNRLEVVRSQADSALTAVRDDEERRCAVVHLYGVSQGCALLALRRGENAELAAVAGMLHDLSAYTTGIRADHAAHGAILAAQLLRDTALFTEKEITCICEAIAHHSDKTDTHASFDEVLKDADVLQHALYAPCAAVTEKERARFDRIMRELGVRLG